MLIALHRTSQFRTSETLDNPKAFSVKDQNGPIADDSER